MKKYLPLIVAIALALCLVAGCTSPAPAPAPTPAPAPAPAATPAPTPESAPAKAMANPNSLVSVEELKQLIGQDNVVVVDYSEKVKDVIPGAIWIDRSKLVRELDGDQMSIESLEVHEKILGENGISENTTIILYGDDNNLYATRFLWQLRAYGHQDVRLLNGGTAAWIAAGEPVEKTAAVPGPAVTYKGVDNVAAVRADLDDVLAATNNPEYRILDTRTQKEWDEGRVPGAIQFTYPADLLNEDGTFKTVEEYEELFKDIPRDAKLIAYCLGGIRSAHMMYILTDFIGWPSEVKNYDGSWWNYSWSKSPIEK